METKAHKGSQNSLQLAEKVNDYLKSLIAITNI